MDALQKSDSEDVNEPASGTGLRSSSTYYEVPSEEIFDEIKSAAAKIWKTYDNEFGYVDEKLSRIDDLKNVDDNWAYIINMFDSNNKAILFLSISPEASEFVGKAMF